MRFVNVSEFDLSFKLGGVSYACKLNGEVEIPDAIAYAVKWHKLPMVEAKSSAPNALKALPVSKL